jgi:hypothetical protein
MDRGRVRECHGKPSKKQVSQIIVDFDTDAAPANFFFSVVAR